MNARQTIAIRFAALGLSLALTGLAHAQGTTGSTDIYSTNFQAVYTSGAVRTDVATTGSTDIYRNSFAQSFATSPEVRIAPVVAKAGSTDIYSTNFQNVYM